MLGKLEEQQGDQGICSRVKMEKQQMRPEIHSGAKTVEP